MNIGLKKMDSIKDWIVPLVILALFVIGAKLSYSAYLASKDDTEKFLFAFMGGMGTVAFVSGIHGILRKKISEK